MGRPTVPATQSGSELRQQNLPGTIIEVRAGFAGLRLDMF